MSARVEAAARAMFGDGWDQAHPDDQAIALDRARVALAAADAAEPPRIVVERRPDGSIVSQGVTYRSPWEDELSCLVQAHRVVLAPESSYHQRVRAAAVVDFVLPSLLDRLDPPVLTRDHEAEIRRDERARDAAAMDALTATGTATDLKGGA